MHRYCFVEPSMGQKIIDPDGLAAFKAVVMGANTKIGFKAQKVSCNGIGFLRTNDALDDAEALLRDRSEMVLDLAHYLTPYSSPKSCPLRLQDPSRSGTAA